MFRPLSINRHEGTREEGFRICDTIDYRRLKLITKCAQLTALYNIHGQLKFRKESPGAQQFACSPRGTCSVRLAAGGGQRAAGGGRAMWVTAHQLRPLVAACRCPPRISPLRVQAASPFFPLPVYRSFPVYLQQIVYLNDNVTNYQHNMQCYMYSDNASHSFIYLQF